MPFNTQGANVVFNGDYNDYGSNHFAHSSERPEGKDTAFVISHPIIHRLLGPVPYKPPYVYIPPHSVSPRFTGQKVYLDQLHVQLTAQESIMRKDRRWALLHGTGGVGKTQLALKFAEDHSET